MASSLVFRSAWLALLVAAGGSAAAQSRHYPPAPEPGYAWAEVVEVTPIHVRDSEPVYREQCWSEPVREVYVPSGRRPHYPHSGPILGAIVGGVIGNQFGSGGGRVAATFAGAVLGDAIVRDSQYAGYRGGPPHQRVVYRERCGPVVTGYRDSEYVDGYDVAYEFGGEIYHTRMDHPPGDRIRVRVDVRPAY